MTAPWDHSQKGSGGTYRIPEIESGLVICKASALPSIPQDIWGTFYSSRAREQSSQEHPKCILWLHFVAQAEQSLAVPDHYLFIWNYHRSPFTSSSGMKRSSSSEMCLSQEEDHLKLIEGQQQVGSQIWRTNLDKQDLICPSQEFRELYILMAIVEI